MSFRESSGRSLFRLRHRNLLGTIKVECSCLIFDRTLFRLACNLLLKNIFFSHSVFSCISCDVEYSLA